MTEELWAKLGPQWRSILLISEVVRDEKREAGILNYIPTVPVSRKLRLGARRVDPNPKGITARGDAAIAADLGVTPDELRDRLRTPPPQRLIEGGTKASAERINMTTWEQIKEAARLARKRGETIPTVLDRQGKGWSLWLYDREEWKPLRDCRVELKIAAVGLFPRMMKEAQSRLNNQMSEASKAAQDLRTLIKVLDVLG